MMVRSIKLPDGMRTKAVKFELEGAVYWLFPQDARIASDWDRRQGETENLTREGFIRDNAVRTDAPAVPPPFAPVEPPGDGWTCADRSLQAQAALLIIVTNKISCCSAMETVADLTFEAGPSFCRTLARELDPRRIPF